MKPILQFLGGAALAVGALEVALRFLPVSSGFTSPPLSADDPVVHYVPRTHYTSSDGWLMRGAVSGQMNSLGFSGPEVRPADKGVALIGDSFVDALAIRPDKKVGYLLQNSDATKPVVSLGVAGADFADYVVTGQWARQHLKIRNQVIVINEEDLSSSIRPKLRGYWYESSGSGVKVRSQSSSELRNVIVRSRLASYLIYNLKFSPADVASSLNPFPVVKKAMASTGDASLKQRAAARFVGDLAALQASGSHILLVIQPNAKAIYTGKPISRPNIDMLSQMAHTAQLEVLNLDAPFRRYFKSSGKRFDLSDTDPHWNEAGHQLAARAIRERITSWYDTGKGAGAASVHIAGKSSGRARASNLTVADRL